MGRQDDAVKTLAIALLNYADDHGYFYSEPAAIRSFARPFDDESTIIRRCLDQLVKIEYIQLRAHPVRGFIGKVTSFDCHQRVDRPKPSTIKEFFDESESTIVLRLIDDESTIDRDGREGKGREGNKDKTFAQKSRGPISNISKNAAANGMGRHERIHQMIMSVYREQNGVECPWNGAEGKQLKDFLASVPQWTDQQIAQCLINLYASEGFPKGDAPHSFLPRLSKYLQSPLDKFQNSMNGNGHKPPASKLPDAMDDHRDRMERKRLQVEREKIERPDLYKGKPQ